MKNQITTVRTANRTGFDQSKVSYVTSHQGFFLYDAEEIVIAGISFDDNRRSLCGAVIDENIHSIREKRIAWRFAHQGRSEGSCFRSRLGDFEVLQVLQNMVMHSVEISNDL